MMKKRLPIELHIVVQHVDFSRLKKKQKKMIHTNQNFGKNQIIQNLQVQILPIQK
jgi:predicted metal-dependent peptidase